MTWRALEVDYVKLSLLRAVTAKGAVTEISREVVDALRVLVPQ